MPPVVKTAIRLFLKTTVLVGNTFVIKVYMYLQVKINNISVKANILDMCTHTYMHSHTWTPLSVLYIFNILFQYMILMVVYIPHMSASCSKTLLDIEKYYLFSF